MNCRGKGFWGLLAIILGLVIILSLLLPSEFWCCGGGAYLGRSVSYEEMLKGVWNENIRYQAAEIPVEIHSTHKQTVIPRGSGA